MKVRQISIFVENQSGRLFEVMNLIGESNINIRALSLADTSDFGIIRLIVNDPQLAYQKLKEHEFTVGINEVLAIEIPDQPGGLASVLGILKSAMINVEYMYAFASKSGGNAVMIFRIDDLDAAITEVAKAGIKQLDEKSLFTI